MSTSTSPGAIRRPQSNRNTEDLLALLKRELADTRNWRADLPPQNHLHVSLRTIEPPAEQRTAGHSPGGRAHLQRARDAARGLPSSRSSARASRSRKTSSSCRTRTPSGLPIPADYHGVREAVRARSVHRAERQRQAFAALVRALAERLFAHRHVGPASDAPVTRDVDYELSYLRRKPVRTVFRGVVKLAAGPTSGWCRAAPCASPCLRRQQVRVSLNAPPQVDAAAGGVRRRQRRGSELHMRRTGESAPRFSTQAEAYQHQQDLICAATRLSPGRFRSFRISSSRA